MATKEQHPSIAKFKDFVKRHPKLSEEVKGKKKTWQELFEEWYLLGEEDESWKSYRVDGKDEEGKGSKSDVIPQILQSLKKMDANQIQYYLNNANSAIGNIQQLIQQFLPQTTKGTSTSSGVKNPFSFRKD
ncbi:YlbD family protein [Sutcliffiella rhizosphaerae]|uniref:Cytosolic protein n=1 Tax=Sutcliffiella rhizosphaerae TaxID=2880967 RepID=A0ABM8YIX2_9BACI|nr:YlbD family protein [Sutcliffiella rhizosphaerae]CAG9619838.1 hypothetical protein BACCIP111883_00606 [Sutcliffiella rhizosphaerae]